MSKEVTHKAYCVESDCDWSKRSNESTAEAMAKNHNNVEGHSVNVVPINSDVEEGFRTKISHGEAMEYELEEIEELNLGALQNICYNLAEEKGWHDEERTFGDYCSLFHSEISEALEAYREGNPYPVVFPEGQEEAFVFTTDQALQFPRGSKPEGIPIELADVLIRILDFCGRYNIDIMQAVKLKLVYNLQREHRHGGKEI